MTVTIYHNEYRVTVEGEGMLMRFHSTNPQNVDHWMRCQLAIFRQFKFEVACHYVSSMEACSNA